MGFHGFVLTMVMAVMAMTATCVVAQESPFCKFAKHKPLCNQMVRGAKTHRDAIKNCLQSMLDLTVVEPKTVVPIVNSVLQRFIPKFTHSGTKECKEAIEVAIDDLKELLDACDNNDNDMIEAYLRTPEITLRGCTDPLEESKVQVPGHLAGLALDMENRKETAIVILLQIPIEEVYNRPLPSGYAG